MSFDSHTLASLVMERCDALACISEEEHSLTRRFLTPAMRAAYDQVGEWMTAAGLSVRIDNAGNLIGRRQRTASLHKDPRVLLVGSHLDTVPNAGSYDGALGVLMAIALVEQLGDEPLPFHLDVVAFSEEEGVRYSMPYLGSSAVAGTFDLKWLDRQDEEGLTMRDAMLDFGLDPAAINQAAYAPDEVIGYLEAHLEQGPILETEGAPVGIVTGIAGQRRLQLRFLGEAAHAGTTPMGARRDALCCAAEFVAQVRQLGVEISGLRATVGRLVVSPNVSNVIPEQVDLSLDLRHVDNGVLDQALEGLLCDADRIAAAGDCEFAVTDRNDIAAAKADKELTDLLRSAAEETGHSPLAMSSGAGHDGVAISERFPMAMLFLRHPGAVSHHPDERVERDDVAVGLDVMRQFVKKLAERESDSKN